jgi:hypothetical protein
MNIRLLTVGDWQIWKDIRLEALQNSPENFGSCYEEELNWSDTEFQEGLTKSNIFGVFIENKLAACAGFYSLTSLKTKHCGVIWGCILDLNIGNKVSQALSFKLLSLMQKTMLYNSI